MKEERTSIVDQTKQRYDKYLEREARIIEAGIKTFGNREYGQATITMIAKEAGVNEATIYKHFSNKQELYETCWHKVLERVAHFFLSGLNASAASPMEIIELGFRESIGAIMESPEAATFTMLLFGAHGDLSKVVIGRDAVAELVTNTIAILEKAKKKGQLNKNIDSMVFAMMILAYLYGMVVVKSMGLEEYIQPDRSWAVFQDIFSKG